MSEIQSQSSEPAGPQPDHSLLPPTGPAPVGGPIPAWAPPPPPAPALANTVWHRLAAAVVVAAVVAAAAGAGVGWSLARNLNAHNSTAQNSTTITQPSVKQPAQPGSPIQPVNPGSGGGLNTAAIAAKVDPALVDITTVVGTGEAAGTGQIISSNGEILTNNHVVDRSTGIQVTIAGQSKSYPAHVIGVDPGADIAVLQVDGVSGWPTVSFASSSSVRVGEAIVALGNALGQGGTPDVSQGSITALDQTITASEGGSKSEQLSGMLQSDASIYPGDSGGPLVNSSGQVVGMITAGDVQGFRSSASTVNYAIPSDTILSVVNLIRAGNPSTSIIYGQTAYIGVSVQNLDSGTASRLNLNVSSGALVVGVQNGSVASGAGITRNAVITSVAGSHVTNIDDLGSTLLAHKPGERASINWVDQTGTHSATVTFAGVNP